ncbi:MAG: TRAP transporter permease [Deltaproteobacteria bacterium]|nr:TRAP transporter permease [Deltaproteobacteria bacterium]
MSKKYALLCTIVAVLMAAFHLYTSGFGRFPALQQRSIHMFFGLALTFLIYSWNRGENKKINFIDTLLIIAGMASCANVFWGIHYHAYERAGAATTLDIWMCVILIVLIIEMTRRLMGWILPIITMFFIAYAFLGPYLYFDFLTHRGATLNYFVQYLYMSTNGIWTTPVAVSATFVAIFILFATFLANSGVGDFFMNAAQAIAGHKTGGPAKVAVISSAAMGSISGSAVGNVVTTGAFTIPLMKRMGFSPVLAGAIEATASTGGQIMPPIMGASAFIIADMVGISYLKVCVACLVPALFYFYCVLAQVHFESELLGLKGVPKETLPRLWETVKNSGYLLSPIIVLIYLLAVGYTAMKAGFWAVVAVVLISSIKKSTRMNSKVIVKSMVDGAKAMLVVLCACACSGIIIGILTMTGMGLKLPFFLVDMSNGSLPVLLILAMLACIVLGMGVTTVAAYLLVAVMITPALVTMGVDLLVAHIFVFYFAVVSTITPPVCLAAYAAAGIADGDPFKTGITAWRMGLAGFFVPFFLVFRPELTLLTGSYWEMILAIVIVFFAVTAVASALTGYMLQKLNMLERVLLAGAVICLIWPTYIMDILGLVIIIVVSLYQALKKAKKKSGSELSAV